MMQQQQMMQMAEKGIPQAVKGMSDAEIQRQAEEQ